MKLDAKSIIFVVLVLCRPCLVVCLTGKTVRVLKGSREKHSLVASGAPNLHRIGPYVGRAWEAAQVTIRHAFPPNWSPVAGKWVHIQPWEFGALPLDWVEPVLENVDEIWVPSNYVRNVYVRSGIPEQHIQVIPWGVNPNVFARDVPPLLLPCEGKFVFLFVGGTISKERI